MRAFSAAWHRISSGIRPQPLVTLLFRHRKALFLVGLFLRLGTAPMDGTQDMEYWKAFATESLRHGVTAIYGAPDAEILRLAREGKTIAEITELTQNQFHYDSFQYDRKVFSCPQPPLFVYLIHLAGLGYTALDPARSSRRLFNLFMNLPPFLATCLTAWLMLLFLGPRLGREMATATALLYWVNPLVLLNSPVQGYLDPIFGFFGIAALMATCQYRFGWAAALATLAILHKPQGILAGLAVLAAAMAVNRRKNLMRGMCAAAATTVAVFLPYLVSGKFLSLLIGMGTSGSPTVDLSRQALNPWWVLQYSLWGYSAFKTGATGFWGAVLGGPHRWWRDYSQADFLSRTGLHLSWIGYPMLVISLGVVMILMVRAIRRDRMAIFLGAACLSFVFYTVRLGAQGNHYFFLIPALSVTALLSPRHLRAVLGSTTFFLVPDFVYYGLGRDWLPPVVEWLASHSAGWVLALWAVGGTVLCFSLIRWLADYPLEESATNAVASNRLLKNSPPARFSGRLG